MEIWDSASPQATVEVWDLERLEADRRSRRMLTLCAPPPRPTLAQQALRGLGGSFGKVLELTLIATAWTVWVYALLRYAVAVG